MRREALVVWSALIPACGGGKHTPPAHDACTDQGYGLVVTGQVTNLAAEVLPIDIKLRDGGGIGVSQEGATPLLGYRNGDDSIHFRFESLFVSLTGLDSAVGTYPVRDYGDNGGSSYPPAGLAPGEAAVPGVSHPYRASEAKYDIGPARGGTVSILSFDASEGGVAHLGFTLDYPNSGRLEGCIVAPLSGVGNVVQADAAIDSAPPDAWLPVGSHYKYVLDPVLPVRTQLGVCTFDLDGDGSADNALGEAFRFWSGDPITSVRCWGKNDVSQLASNGPESRVPVPISDLLASAQAIDSAGGQTCVVTSGTVKCWGNGITAPTQVAGLSNVQAVALGDQHACALSAGSVWCWGANGDGQLGNNSTTDSATPVAVTGLTGVQAIAAGTAFTCAVISTGIRCWGNNLSGQLGNNSNTSSKVPVTVANTTTGVESISAAGGHTCAIVNSAVKCWGSNAYGELGNGSQINAWVPVQVSGLTAGAKQLATGVLHSCALVSGSVVCWGGNASGQLGDGTTNESHVPVTTFLVDPVTALGGGDYHTCAVTGDGLSCWGYNSHGQIGNGSTTNVLAPTLVPNTTNARVATGGVEHTCVLAEQTHLVDIQTPAFVATQARAAVFVGTDPDRDPADNLSGSETFAIRGDSQLDSILDGPISAASRFQGGPGHHSIELTGFEGEPIVTALRRASIAGDISAASITNGILAGGIPVEAVDQLVLGLWRRVKAVVSRDCTAAPPNCCPSGSPGGSALGLFDTNGDCSISLAELKASSLVTSTFAPDLDLIDGAGLPGSDGVDDSLSFGLCFRGAGASFVWP